MPGVKGEIDLVGYDGEVLAFIEVKTRTGEPGAFGLPEDAVTPDKRRHLSRMAGQFRAQWRLRERPFRFDVVAIEVASRRQARCPPAQRGIQLDEFHNMRLLTDIARPCTCLFPRRARAR